MGCAWLAVLSRAPIAAATQPPAQAVVAAPAGSSVDVVEIGSAAIKAQTGLAYSAAVAIPEDEADGPADVRRSQWLLLEDDLPLGPGHCLPASIAAKPISRP